jgi:hypothetical protein
MSHLFQTNLIRIFDFYLMLLFIIGIVRRWSMYKNILILTFAAVIKQPNLIRRLHANKDLLLNKQTLLPFGLAFGLMVLQFVMSRLIWPEATITIQDMTTHPWELVLMVALFVPMFCVDLYFLIQVGKIDRSEAVKQMDRAEHWLTSWQAPVVKILSFGKIDPRKMVDDQLRSGLTWFGSLLSWSMWWVVVQVGLRLAFGITLWLLWLLGFGSKL